MAALQASAPAVQSSSFSPYGVGSFESGGSSGSRAGSPAQRVSPKVAFPTMAAVTILEPAFPDGGYTQPLFGTLTDHLDQMVRINTWPALRLPFNVQHGTVLTLRLFRTPPSSTEGFSDFDFVAGLQVPVGKLLAMGNPLQCWCALSADIGTLQVADSADQARATMEAFKTVRQKATYDICPKVFIALRPIRQDHVPRSLVGESTATPLSVSGSASMLGSQMQLTPLSSLPGWDRSPSQTDAMHVARVTPQRTRSNSPSASMQMVQAELSAEKQQLLKDISALTAEAQLQSAATQELSTHGEAALQEEQRVQDQRELRERLAELHQEKPLKKHAASSASSHTGAATPGPVAEAAAPSLRDPRREAQDERQQITTLRYELRAERDRFKAFQHSTDVETHSTNCHMSELYEMLEAERAAVSLWQEDSLEAQLSWCGDRARWCARVENLKSELARLKSVEAGEPESAVSKRQSGRLDFNFDKLHYEQVDSEIFKNEFVLSLGMLGVTPALLARLNIHVREGSVIAGVQGPASAINDLKRLLLAGQLSVMGSVARVEEALVPGQLEHEDLRQRAEVLSQECEVLKSRRLYDDLYARHEALEQEVEAMQTRSLKSVDIAEHEALKLTCKQLQEEREVGTVDSIGMSAADYIALQERLKSLSVELEALEKECACRVDSKEHETLQQEYQALQREHQSLKSDAEALKSRAEALESQAPRGIDLSDFEGLRGENEGLRGKYEILERECTDLKNVSSQITAISSENAELKERCIRLHQEISELRAKTTSAVEAERHLDLERRFDSLSLEHKELSKENDQLKELQTQLMRSSDAAALRAQEDFEELQRGRQALEAELQVLQRSHATELKTVQEKHDSLNIRLEHANESLQNVPRGIHLSQHEALQVQNTALERGHKQMSDEMEREHRNFSSCRQQLQERFDSSHIEMRDTFLEELQAKEKAHALKLTQELEALQKKHDHTINTVQRAHTQALSEREQAEKALGRRWEAELHEECSHAATAVVAADAAGSARATSALQGRVELLKGELRDFQLALQQEKERGVSEVRAAESGADEATLQMTLAREAMEKMEEQVLAAQSRIPAANNLLSTIEQQEASNAKTHLELRELQESEAQDAVKREEIDSVRAQILGTIEARVSMLQDEVMRERDMYGYHAGHGAELESQFEQLRAYTEERDEQLLQLQALCEDEQLFRQPGDVAMMANLRTEAAHAGRAEKKMHDAHSELLTQYRVAEGMLAAQEPMLCDSRQELAAAEAQVRVLRQELLEQGGARLSANAAKDSPVIQRTPSFEVIHGDVFNNGALHDQEGADIAAALSAASSRPSTPHTTDSRGIHSQFRRSPSSASSISAAASGVDGSQVANGQTPNGSNFLALPPGPSSEQVQLVVELDRTGGDALGIDLHGASLLIDAVIDGGLFSKWNKANPFQAVRAGDRISAVNGRQTAEDIIAEMQDYKLLSITVVRDTPVAEEETTSQAKSKAAPSAPAKSGASGFPKEAHVVNKFVVDSLDPEALAIEVGDMVTVLMVNATWAHVTHNGATGEVPLMCLDLEGSMPEPKPVRRSSVTAQPSQTAVRAAARKPAVDISTQNSVGNRREIIEQKPRLSSGTQRVSSTLSDARTRRPSSVTPGVPVAIQRPSQSNASTPKSTASGSMPKSPGKAAAVPPAVSTPQVDKKRSGSLSGSLSRSGSAMSLGSGSASDARSNNPRASIKGKATSKATAERRGLDVYMASLRG